MSATSGSQPGAGSPADPRSSDLAVAHGGVASEQDAAQSAAAAPPPPPLPMPSQQHASYPQQQHSTSLSSPTAADSDAETYESRHVHTVYEAIAPHFSSTRYKPWPLVSSFLLSLAPGSVGLDAGCGNGKYIGVNPSLYIIASDRSANLVSLARDYQPPFFNTDGKDHKSKSKSKSKKPAEETPAPSATTRNQVLVADSLALPYRHSCFDFAISIAVIHHMSTPTRRRAAVEALLSAVRPGTGRALVMVWALEQGNSRRGWTEGAEQDQLVSWVTKGKKTDDQPEARDTTYQRYYHLYREGELEEDVVAVGGRVLESGYERDNWWAIFCRDA
ncbi:tRNA (carboxymethyluridine(34)-5-O)-methyltransferase [Colletotrichum trifolii]|uniref:tRNA (Carboxymethyluridine(34)-5-O)-methyltransferase n=1 Tax=Colletotrichum trifolii TaxID=5466 RepID=A0A4R8RVX0_COLTR|nr:tRNA (carboxymethyluridine(34)-5-O)-methyltransferase [Colletotrichum trifolii]